MTDAPAHDDDGYDSEFDALVAPTAPISHLPPPSLAPAPAVYPGCCVALSEALIGNLGALLPPAPALVVSIGSGSGLFEALLLAEPCCLSLIGVEVQPSVNRYLPSSRHRAVVGTYSLEPLAAEATAWLFVYPRRVGLVDEYLATYGEGAVQTVMWIGPTADWQDYKACFGRGWDVRVTCADEMGGRAWEVVAVATKTPP
ncbi:hypothetical protein P280DRAFT_507278 [Massarina eburnea CBS 473.64]|uniref:Uncharacterized protein n=1 Tax=Massarina eburnea CBS 473.64 TaxID=1395130 RepID=A0A6A6S1T2_9PLEO|nr:hypothetical protein P280DRAFT_507278 [Massarina eburnea CBS 473.64]